MSPPSASAAPGRFRLGERRITRFDGDFGYDVPMVRGGGTAHRTNGDGGTNSLLGAVRLGGAQSLVELRGDYLDVDRGLPGSIVSPTPDARQPSVA